VQIPKYRSEDLLMPSSRAGAGAGAGAGAEAGTTRSSSSKSNAGFATLPSALPSSSSAGASSDAHSSAGTAAPSKPSASVRNLFGLLGRTASSSNAPKGSADTTSSSSSGGGVGIVKPSSSSKSIHIHRAGSTNAGSAAPVSTSTTAAGALSPRSPLFLGSVPVGSSVLMQGSSSSAATAAAVGAVQSSLARPVSTSATSSSDHSLYRDRSYSGIGASVIADSTGGAASAHQADTRSPVITAVPLERSTSDSGAAPLDQGRSGLDSLPKSDAGGVGSTEFLEVDEEDDAPVFNGATGQYVTYSSEDETADAGAGDALHGSSAGLSGGDGTGAAGSAGYGDASTSTAAAGSNTKKKRTMSSRSDVKTSDELGPGPAGHQRSDSSHSPAVDAVPVTAPSTSLPGAIAQPSAGPSVNAGAIPPPSMPGAAIDAAQSKPLHGRRGECCEV